MTDFLTIYRCSECGKWSHAVRKPKFHERFVRDEPEDDDVVLETTLPTYDYEGVGADGGWKIRCGPFDAYIAFKDPALPFKRAK